MNTPASIAHYQLLELIGQDGPVETWRARDARLQRTVALQVLRRGPDTTQEAIDRFRRQAHVASLVTHPHICAVHNWGEDDGQPFVVRELLSGERLDQLLARGALAPDRVLELAIQLTGALCAVHRRGLVHGQLRPSHIRVTADGHVKLLGLGTAVADPNAAAPDLGAFATTAVDIETAAPSRGADRGRSVPVAGTGRGTSADRRERRVRDGRAALRDGDRHAAIQRRDGGGVVQGHPLCRPRAGEARQPARSRGARRA